MAVVNSRDNVLQRLPAEKTRRSGYGPDPISILDLDCHVLGKIEPTKSGGVSSGLQAQHRVRSTLDIGETIGQVRSPQPTDGATEGPAEAVGE